MRSFDLNPHPKLLVALTRTAMKPIDALCELIDNSIDSFNTPGREGRVNEIHIQLPTKGMLEQGNDITPFIVVSDNGPGMTPQQTERALTAGYSGKNWHGELGLFGVGLNIATGKFACKTRVITATADSQDALVVDLDLNQIIKQGDFKVPSQSQPKGKYFSEKEGSGTKIELIGRWPKGDVNHDFPKKLIQNGPGKVSKILGRRYAALLRKNANPKFSIFVNTEKCEPFEHCAWSPSRFVIRHGAKIPAMQEFNHQLEGSSKKCLECGAAIQDGKCVMDETHSGSKTVPHVVRGWIGVQRFDDLSNFGIDLIRNGRTIRVSEKDAFFKFISDLGEEIKDYPIDDNYGRIIGEVHLDHVPVNFTKEDFERSSAEWADAMVFLRGNSSFQPAKPGANQNYSPVMKIFTGFRKVRNFGPKDLYMAKWENGKPVSVGDDENKYARIERSVEKEFYAKFLNKEEGYYSDEKWFEYVDVSSYTGSFQDCPNPDCDAQNPPEAEICNTCGFLLKSKKCLNNDCGKDIPESAEICKHCETSQEPEGPWDCKVCGYSKNPPDVQECRKCKSQKGAANQFDEERLMENSTLDDSLSREIEIDLPGDKKTTKLRLEARNASLKSGNIHIPAVIFEKASEQKVLLFLDRTHPSFSLLHPHYAAAEAAAEYVYQYSTHIKQSARKHEHNLVTLTCRILDKHWREDIADDANKVRTDINNFWDEMRPKMAANLKEIATDIFDSISDAQKRSMMSAMMEAQIDVGNMTALKESGDFMLYIPPDAIGEIFNQYAGRFFGGRVWHYAWDIPEVSEEVARDTQARTKKTYMNCIEDCISFWNSKANLPPLSVRRARLSLEFLEKHLAE